MKFKAYQEKSSTWFVNTHKTKGKQFGKRFETEIEAKQFALIKTHDYHIQQMDKAYLELEKICEMNSNGEIKPIGYDCFCNQSDFSC